MEYIIGFLSAIVFVYFLVRIQNKYDVLRSRLKFSKSTQSRNHYLFERDVTPVQKKKKEVNRQSTKHDKNVNIRVIIMDDQAYWIKDNVFILQNLTMALLIKKLQKKLTQ